MKPMDKKQMGKMMDEKTPKKASPKKGAKGVKGPKKQPPCKSCGD